MKSANTNRSPKALIKKEITFPVRGTLTNEKSLMLHTEYCKGTYKGTKFRFIGNFDNKGFRLEYGGYHIDIGTFDLVSDLMDAMLEHLKNKA